MVDRAGVFADIDKNVAANVREYRDRAGLSQEDLAARMGERGFGFTQATVWKIEQGQRTVKLNEALALHDALGLRAWDSLTTPPVKTRLEANLHQAHIRAAAAFEAVKNAATNYIKAQYDVLIAAHDASEADIAVAPLFTTWLDVLVEQAVVEARVDWKREDEEGEHRADEIHRIMQALRDNGYNPEPLRLEDVEHEGGPLPA